MSSGVLRNRNRPGTAAAAPRDWRKPKEGTFAAHLPNSWTVSSYEAGSHYGIKAVRKPPLSGNAKVLANPCVREGRLSSESVGIFSGIKPAFRPRPASEATVMLKNPCIADGYVSSEPVGHFAWAEGFPPRRTMDPAERVHLPKSRNPSRPRTAPIHMLRTTRTSDVIGTHPRPETPDINDAATMHFEAQFSHRFGDGRTGDSVLANKWTKAAAEFQQKWIERAKKLNEQEMGWFDESEGKSVRVDGAQMEKMEFDAVYSNKHVHKDTESGLGPGFIPVIDPRRDSITRPKDLGYGFTHIIQTKLGERQPLPSRSVLGIGSGRGRTIDF